MHENIARYIDAAVLKPETTPSEAEEAIEICIRYSAITVCVRPCDIERALEMCRGTKTSVSCVLDFPHGSALRAVKAAEAREYVRLNVSEIDMVVNYGLIRAGDMRALADDIHAVTDIAGPAGVPVKTILETVHLTTQQIQAATATAIDAGASFVKTSTGFAGGGATPEAVRAMLDAAGNRIKVKASGGIRDRRTAEMYINMGCARLGVGYTSLQAICEGKVSESDY